MEANNNEITTLEEHEPWCGAKYWHEHLCNLGLGESFISYLEGYFPDGLTETQLNDILWFEDDLLIGFLFETKVPLNEMMDEFRWTEEDVNGFELAL